MLKKQVGLCQGSTLQSTSGNNDNVLVMEITDSSDGTNEGLYKLLDEQNSNAQTTFDYKNDSLVVGSTDFLIDRSIEAQHKPVDEQDTIVQSRPGQSVQSQSTPSQ
ncbi:hypothetical protein EVAR_13633_1 [Eumeta japonica]|uniref:Uncharacterized protein n=1 Tax=Eumeta variegata TaxID=151549 RepID=A0A4C1UU15_EUMVA|nr:hypothetical protein EVAR_13633_1 [Eumeta japonica]